MDDGWIHEGWLCLKGTTEDLKDGAAVAVSPSLFFLARKTS